MNYFEMSTLHVTPIAEHPRPTSLGTKWWDGDAQRPVGAMVGQEERWMWDMYEDQVHVVPGRLVHQRKVTANSIDPGRANRKILPLFSLVS